MLDYNKLHTAPERSPVKSTLRKLYLSENQLVRFPNDYFKGFLQLQDLQVADNHLVAAPSVSWIASTLELLSLEKKRITSATGIYSQMPFQKLSMLYLQENEITTFDVRILSKMPILRHLRIDTNRIRHISDYRPYFSHTDIILHVNPFHCDMKMAWMSKVVNIFVCQATCATPWCLKGKLVAIMSEYCVLYISLLNIIFNY